MVGRLLLIGLLPSVAQQLHPCTPAAHLASPPPQRPVLSEQASKFLWLEREAEQEYRPQIVAALEGKVQALAESLRTLLAVVAPYPLAARLAYVLLGVEISPMGVGRVTQRLGEAALNYSEELSAYHNDSR